MATYSPTQDGYLNSATAPWSGTGLWNDTGATFSALGTLGPAGLVFDLATGVTFSAATLSIHCELRVAAAGGGHWRLYLSDDPTPALWSDANPPTRTGATLIASLAVGDPVDVPGTRTFDLDAAVLAALTSQPSWSGRIALVLTFEGAVEGMSSQFTASESGDVANRPALTTTETPIVVAPLPSRVYHPRPPDHRPRRRVRV